MAGLIIRVFYVTIISEKDVQVGYFALLSDIIPSIAATVRITQIILGSVGPLLSGIFTIYPTHTVQLPYLPKVTHSQTP